MAPTRTRTLVTAILLMLGALAATAGSARAAVTATFSQGSLVVLGDSADNTIAVSRDAAGKLLVNGGAVNVLGGTATVANTADVRVFGLGGRDAITMDEAGGALPRGILFGGEGDDTLTGGSGADQMFGQAGNDRLFGRGSADFVFGGSEHDTLTGGDHDDQVFGESGNDRMVWNPGDDTDLNEGGADMDTVQVNGGAGAEDFSAAANGARVRFGRAGSSAFALDVGTTEKLTLNANGGNDTFFATGDLASLMTITVAGGTGNDSLQGGNGADVLSGGDGDDFADGQQGNDSVLLGAGADSFRWDPADGSDVVEGQTGVDAMLLNGSNGDERITASAVTGRLRLSRSAGQVSLDLASIEALTVKTFGGIDDVVVGNLAGSGVASVKADLGAAGGGADTQADDVDVSATNGGEVVRVSGSGAGAKVDGVAAPVTVAGASAQRPADGARAGGC